MAKPFIGITMSQDRKDNLFILKKAYAKSIAEVGGIPILLASENITEDSLEWTKRLDGILFSGGTDILPKYFEEESFDGFKMEYEMVPERDEFEIQLFQQTWKQKMPILGICRGIQLIAVAAGGKLTQDIETGIKREIKIRHMQKAPDWCFEGGHKIYLEEESKLFRYYQEKEVWVNSFHHQAVSSVPEGFRQTAKASDGVIEAIEAMNYPFCIGVQWHPERTIEGSSGDKKLFQDFIKEAEFYAKRK